MHATGMYPVCSCKHTTIRMTRQGAYKRVCRPNEAKKAQLSLAAVSEKDVTYLLIVTEAREVPTAIVKPDIIAILGPRHREAQCMSREL
jgi:hypothetical protein